MAVGLAAAVGHVALAVLLPWAIHFLAPKWVVAHGGLLNIISNVAPASFLGAIGAYGLFRAAKQRHPYVAELVGAAGVGALAWLLRSSYPYLPAKAAMFGFGSHLALDCVWGRCPWLFWPFRRRGHFAGAGLGLAKTGHFSDKLFGWICVFAFPVLMVLVVIHSGHLPAGLEHLRTKLPSIPAR